MAWLIPEMDKSREICLMRPGFINSITGAGGIPIMLPLTISEDEIDELASICDGILFSGGQDINPALYNEEKLPQCGPLMEPLDRMETILYAKAVEKDRPVLGICRGFQLINAVNGGSLYQDLDTQYDTDLIHKQTTPRQMPVHSVRLVNGSPLQVQIGKDRIPVNSFHHQAIKKLADNFKPMAYAPDGIVEAYYDPTKRFLWAVQWHPESMTWINDDQKKIFDAFVQAAAKKMEELDNATCKLCTDEEDNNIHQHFQQEESIEKPGNIHSTGSVQPESTQPGDMETQSMQTGSMDKRAGNEEPLSSVQSEGTGEGRL